MNPGGDKITDRELRDTVIKLEGAAEHISKTVDKLAGVVDAHVRKSSESARDLHAKIEGHRLAAEERFMTKDLHVAELSLVDSKVAALRAIVKWAGGILSAVIVAVILAGLSMAFLGKV